VPRTLTGLVEGTSALSLSASLEAEFVKDRWDARNIPGLRYPPHRNDHYIIFTGVPDVYRPVVKDHVKFLLAAGRAAKTLIDGARCLEHFFTFFLSRYPNATTLQALSEQDVDAFVASLKADAHTRGLRRGDVYVWNHVHCLEGLLSYLERIQSPMRPKEPTIRIVWPHHYPHWEKAGTERVKYIPRTVLDQLDSHLPHLRSTYIPIVLLLRASGWRISDVLYLKLDTCLEQEGQDRYWLVGDIQKTRVLGHKIPITKEVAAIVLAQIEWVKQHYPPEENPKGWLFPASKKNRHRNSPRFLQGETLAVTGITETLNHLATTYQIQDEQSKIFHFKSHAFRHTKAVELINNGMSLVMVQQWMAHASPEMTLIYAKILDETMRAQWEKTVQRGIVQFNDGKPEYVPGKKLLPMAGSNAFDPERVREHRQNVKMALGSCLKTAKIVCKFVELPCFHCPAYVLTPDDLPALQAYEQQILERIEIGKQAGNMHWIEVNQKNLDERVRPTIAMLKEGQIVAKSEKYEREDTPDEWTQRQAERQKEEPDE
jgi:integrase